MRIRQVKPAFWTDRTLAGLSYQARLFYIGLWCVADDAGWLVWDLDELGALLFPYESNKVRERHLSSWSTELVESGRIAILDCGCAHVPTLETHQRHAGGNRSFQYRDAHMRHRLSTSTDLSEPVRTSGAGTVGNGRVGNVTVGNGSARATDVENDEESDFQRLVPRPGAAAGVH